MTQPLHIAIVHYHLRRGGVTRVIRHALAAAGTHDVRFTVLVGESPPPEAAELPHVVIDGLGYDRDGDSIAPGQLADRIEASARDALGVEPDVYHLHNHALGKNLALPPAVCELARRGRRLLLQVHDFAEDGRPENYRRLIEHLSPDDPAALGAMLYPIGPHVFYAPINSRDARFLAEAGAGNAVAMLPNAVALDGADGEALPPDPGGERLFLYPTRAIRRKNVGEVLLWAALARRGDRFALTLAPENPEHRPVYARWVALARLLNLPVEWELGRRTSRPFVELLRSAHRLVTTSVTEGFGLAFLEPWLVARPLVGRNLPEITAEFHDAGVDLSALYDRLEVPLAWVGAERLRERIDRAFADRAEAYRITPDADAVDRAFDAMVRGDRVDFGRLDEPLQERVLTRLVRDGGAGGKAVSPSRLDPIEDPAGRVMANQAAVRKGFGLDEYAARLVRIYRRVVISEPGEVGALDAAVLLRRYLAPERFVLLGT